MTAFLKTPKGYALVALLLLTAVAGVHPEGRGMWLNLAVAVLTAVLIDVAVALVQRRKRILPDGAVLTGLIVAMVLSGGVPWYQTAVTAAIAIGAKHVLKVGRKPIFNPAALGLAAAIPLFHAGQSWWGGLALLPAWTVPLLLVAGGIVAGRANKFPVVLTFLATYFGLFLAAGLLHLDGVADALRPPFSNAVLYLALFMVTDPPTSPAKNDDQIVFGIAAAVISVVDYFLLGGLSFLLVGLLVANGWNAYRARKA